jgi:hypothetical protein
MCVIVRVGISVCMYGFKCVCRVFLCVYRSVCRYSCVIYSRMYICIHPAVGGLVKMLTRNAQLNRE